MGTVTVHAEEPKVRHKSALGASQDASTARIWIYHHRHQTPSCNGYPAALCVNPPWPVSRDTLTDPAGAATCATRCRDSSSSRVLTLRSTLLVAMLKNTRTDTLWATQLLCCSQAAVHVLQRHTRYAAGEQRCCRLAEGGVVTLLLLKVNNCVSRYHLCPTDTVQYSSAALATRHKRSKHTSAPARCTLCTVTVWQRTRRWAISMDPCHHGGSCCPLYTWAHTALNTWLPAASAARRHTRESMSSSRHSQVAAREAILENHAGKDPPTL